MSINNDELLEGRVRDTIHEMLGMKPKSSKEIHQEDVVVALPDEVIKDEIRRRMKRNQAQSGGSGDDLLSRLGRRDK